MKVTCQECGRPANYRTKRPSHKIVSRKDHDLCARCWRKFMDGLTASERTALVEFRETTRYAGKETAA